MTRFIQVQTTAPSRSEAKAIANRLLAERLAACVQVLGPVQSSYYWKGGIERAEEWLCLIKTASELFPRVETAITAASSYETPEIIATPIAAVSDAYATWLQSELGKEIPHEADH